MKGRTFVSAERSVPLRLAGYAALFDRIDRGGDLIEQGAFAGSLARLRDPLPLLVQHDPLRRVGTVSHASEDRRGLRIIAGIENPDAASSHLFTGAGLSFGYRVVSSEGRRPRRLHRIELVEVSLVHVPMQTGARVHMILPRTLSIERISPSAIPPLPGSG